MSNKRMAEIFDAAANEADPMSQKYRQFNEIGGQAFQNFASISVEEMAAGRVVARALRAIAASYRRAAEEMPDGN